MSARAVSTTGRPAEVSLEAPPTAALRPSTLESTLQRTVKILPASHPKGEPSNFIKTSKYTPLTFVPVTLYELLHPRKRFANFYFLVVGFLQCFKEISPRGDAYPSMWVVLIMLVGLDMFLLYREDRARHRADTMANSSPVEVLHGAGPAEFLRETWADVRVGDVVRVRSREPIPADVLLLRGASPPGQCFVKTTQLDGETDAKLRLAPKVTAALLAERTDGEGVREALRGEVLCELPNDKVNDFTGQLRLDGAAPCMLSEENVLLRGSTLATTEWAICLVLVVGKHTKINFGRGRQEQQKLSHTMRLVNYNLQGVVCALLAIVVLGVVLDASSRASRPRGQPWYIDEKYTGALSVEDGFLSGATYFMLTYPFIPVSLYVSMNIILIASRFWVAYDLSLYDEESDERCQVRQMSLIDELGQVSHVFSDKTGTLTSNRMEFRRVFAAGTAFGAGHTAISRSLARAASSSTSSSPPPRRASAEASPTTSPTAENDGWVAGGRPPSRDVSRPGSGGTRLPPILQPFVPGCGDGRGRYVRFEEEAGAPSFVETLASADAQGAACRHLLVAMAVNHSVHLERVGENVELAASSPDEQAFVAAAEHFGYTFGGRDSERGVVTVVDRREGGAAHGVQVLQTFPYESSRKCMSVVVRLPPSLVDACGGGSAVRLYVKGADSALMPRLAAEQPHSPAAGRSVVETVDATLCDWAAMALRTLVWAFRELPDAEYAAWAERYRAATEDPVQVAAQKAGQPCEITALQAELEAGLTLQGATGIEDKLQDGVPELLADMREAGIAVWMLTGDKVGTAKNIAKACNMFPSSADVLELTSESHEALASLKTAQLVVAQRRVDMVAQQGGVISAAQMASDDDEHGVESLRGASPTASGLLGCFRRRRDGGATSAAVARSAAAMAQLKSEVAQLEERHPGLAEVREALERTRERLRRGSAADAAAQRADSPGAWLGRSRSVTMLGAKSGLTFVLDERAIEYCSFACREALVAVASSSRSVVACRARKDQKAQLLRLVKEAVPQACCLAIGDGANDVAMIKAAHIGVGIIGKEGRQAVNNSDFAIGQFRFLRHLLFVHGRWAYRRMCVFAQYMFYKNVALVLTMYFYSLLAMATPVMFLPALYYEQYNVIYTALPCLIYGFNDQDVPKAEAAVSPGLYTPGIHRTHFTTRSFWRWMGEGAALAAAAVFLPAASLSLWGSAAPDRGDYGFVCLSFTAVVITCVGVNLRLALEAHSWSILESLGYFLSLLALELSFLTMANVYPTGFWAEFPWTNWGSFHGTHNVIFTQPAFWLVLLLAIVAASILPLALRSHEDRAVAARRTNKLAPAESWISAGKASMRVNWGPYVGMSTEEMDALGESANDPRAGRMLPSGVRVVDLVVGSGPEPAAGTRVWAHYKVWSGGFRRGPVADLSFFDNRPVDWILGQPTERIPVGVDQGIIGMREGGWRRLVVPAELAFGETGLRKVGKRPGSSPAEQRYTPAKAPYVIRPGETAFYDLIMVDGGSGRCESLLRPPGMSEKRARKLKSLTCSYLFETY